MGTYQVIEVNADTMSVLMNGMVVDFKINDATMIDGMKMQGTQSMQMRVDASDRTRGSSHVAAPP